MRAESATAAVWQPTRVTWLYGPTFDGFFIAGLASMAILCGVVLQANPQWFAPLFFLSMWGLGFPHVIATFSRLAFDKPSFREHRFLVLGLPPLLFVGVFALGMSQGQWTLATIYLYWQAFHYTRQSYGIAQAYARGSDKATVVNHQLSRAIIYAVPLWGMLYRSFQDPGFFLGLDVRFLPVPELAVRAVGVATGGLIVWWCVEQWQAARRGELAVSHFLYMISHIAVFTTGYLLVESLDIGWLVINIWHSAQYILFVWYFQAKRFRGGIDPERQFLSRLSQPRSVGWFFATCLVISTVAYNVFFQLSEVLPLHPVTLAFLIGQTLNYHHYIVDGIIWRRPAMARATAA